jgi:hypothetical protein
MNNCINYINLIDKNNENENKKLNLNYLKNVNCCLCGEIKKKYNTFEFKFNNKKTFICFDCRN